MLGKSQGWSGSEIQCSSPIVFSSVYGLATRATELHRHHTRATPELCQKKRQKQRRKPQNQQQEEQKQRAVYKNMYKYKESAAAAEAEGRAKAGARAKAGEVVGGWGRDWGTRRGHDGGLRDRFSPRFSPRAGSLSLSDAPSGAAPVSATPQCHARFYLFPVPRTGSNPECRP